MAEAMSLAERERDALAARLAGATEQNAILRRLAANASSLLKQKFPPSYSPGICYDIDEFLTETPAPSGAGGEGRGT